MDFHDPKLLPPIIEDKTDNMSHMHYRKELEESRPKINGSGSHVDGNQTAHDNSSNSTQIPYQSWKSKNAAYFKKPDSLSCAPEMLSQLGQSLESKPMVVPYTRHSPSGRQFLPQEKDSLEFQQIQEIHAPTGNVYPNFNKQGRYNLPMSFNPQTLDGQSRGYFPDQSSKFQDQSQMIFGKDMSTSNTYSFQHTPPHQLNASTNYMPSDPSQSYKPQMYHHNNEYVRVQSCPKDYCRNTPHIQTTPVINRFNPGNMQATHDNSAYHPDCSPKTVIHSPQSFCTCHLKNKNSNKIMKKQIDELYRIVWLQNQQIMDLQNQISKKRNEENDSRKIKDQDISKETSEKRLFNFAVIGENQTKKEKVSVGIMTSFIENTKVKSKRKDKESKRFQKLQKYSSSSSSTETSSEDISDDDSIKKLSSRSRKPTDESIMLNGLAIQTISEDHSPRSSPVHVEMPDYSQSSNSDESGSSSECESENPTPVTWTFFDKVVGNVNNILRKSYPDDSNYKHEIRNITLEEFRNRGINVPDSDCHTLKQVSFDPKSGFRTQSDISMKINAITNMYGQNLPYKQQIKDANESPKKVKKSKKNKEIIEGKPHHKKKSKRREQPGKILDIAAIKQQPKLLPKKT